MTLMATALAFGILIAATLTLLLNPCAYIIMDDFRALFIREDPAIESG
ncbi:MAG: hypothetical protein O2780_12815 [Proteobacteria bacterium]|jgi:multidrug efflux pump subunit AcrB|nr:hypothetical protein [Pseudomonadota bacterium]MDA1300124.1 hypothetical protein [Pseudomonadota bacterium]